MRIAGPLAALSLFVLVGPARGAEAPGGAAAAPTAPAKLPPVVVEGSRSGLAEDEPVGSYGQPEWTTSRRFPTTRVYVIPQGQMGLESWLRIKESRDGETEWEIRQEFEVGLPYRFQLDLYLIERLKDHAEESHIDQSIELRWAPFDWGQFIGNPAFYFEFINQENDPEKIETKLLLGDALAPRWHWGANLVWEHEMGGDERPNEFELTTGISYSVFDQFLGVGAEGKFSIGNVAGSRNEWEEDLRLGPSVQIRPIPDVHIDVAPLFGLNSDSRKADVFLVVGWDF